MRGLDRAQFERLSSLLDDVLARPLGEREPWLADLATRDPYASEQLRQLLASLSFAECERFLETREIVDARFAAAMRTEPSSGRMIGPYRVQQPLGQGGMGTVWLAERADGLFERKVALKLVHPALVGSAAAERFARERAILASLDHPNIARLLDAGVTTDDQPYLALEYVEGTAITAYCDERHLDLDTRIELFEQALNAVHYAHANLVIHRDIKPSNILVTAQAQVRLLDFGIAKLITGADTKETELTQLAGRAFTPEYASPEQVIGSPITTASDIYSLGVVLYELLCGHRPYVLRRESRGALEDAIVAEEPANPSQTIASATTAAARSSTPKALRQLLAGDLDTIAQKALRKKPAERYESAHAMMQDLERYRRGEPVLARPSSTAYRFGKFVARNKLAATAAAATVLGLAGGLAGALWQASVAREQAAVAQREATRAGAVQEFLIDLFRANSVEQPDPKKARQTTARELLDLGGARVDEALKDAPDARAKVLDTLADMYYQLGMNAEAARQRAREVTVLKHAYGPNDRRVAEALLLYAADIADLPERNQVLGVLNEAKGILDAVHDDSSEARGQLLMRLAQENRYAAIDKMRVYADEAVAFYRQHLPQSSNLRLALTFAGSARMQQGDPEAAETLYRQALDEVARTEKEPSPWSVFPLTSLAEAQTSLGNLSGAEESYRSALAAAMASYGEFHLETLLTQVKLGGFLHSSGRREQGNQWMEIAYAGIGKDKGGYTPPFAVAVLSGMRGRELIAEGRLEEAAPLVRVDLADAREHFPASMPLVVALHSQIMLDTALGRYADADSKVRESFAILASSSASAVRNRLLLDQSRLLLARGELAAAIDVLQSVTAPPYAPKLPLRTHEVAVKTLIAEALIREGRITEATASAQDANDQIVASSLRRYYPALEADAALRLGEAQRLAGEPQTAKPNLERALRLREAVHDARSPWIAEAQAALAACLLDLGERKAASGLVTKAHAIVAAHDTLGPHLLAPLSEVAARLRAS